MGSMAIKRNAAVGLKWPMIVCARYKIFVPVQDVAPLTLYFHLP